MAAQKTRTDSFIWWMPVLVGAISIVAGIIAIVYPDLSLLGLALIAGINLLLLGAVMVGEALAGDDHSDRTLRVVIGILGILAGIVVLRRPGETLLVIIIVLGLWMVGEGLVGIVRAILMPTGSRVLGVVVALVELALGVLVLSLPHESLATVAILIGISFVVRGVFLVLAGLALRHLTPESPPASAPA